MKFLSLLAVALLLTGSAGAQTLKVSLRSESGPLPYSYVYLNGRAAAVTDTAGIAQLPTGTWSVGDTLTA